MVRTWHCHCLARVQSLVRELRFRQAWPKWKRKKEARVLREIRVIRSKESQGECWASAGALSFCSPAGSRGCCAVARSCLTLCDPWTAARQASLSFTISCRLLKLMSTGSVMPFSHLILCHPLLPLPSSSRVFSSELALCIRWPKYWCFPTSLTAY